VLANKLAARAAPETAGIRKIAELVDQSITQARELARGLQPVMFESVGLEAALRELAEKAEAMFRISCLTVCDGPVYVHDNVTATHLYRITQEAISNAVKHGKAKTVVIDLAASAGELKLTVTDDGVGLGNAPGDGKGIGLQTMEYRVRLIGGAFDLGPGENGGTVVTCIVPLLSSDGQQPGSTRRPDRHEAKEEIPASEAGPRQSAVGRQSASRASAAAPTTRGAGGATTAARRAKRGLRRR
jgi:signal transduction histidine kinase